MGNRESVPYLDLLSFAEMKVEDLETALLEWCPRWGLLGLLHHQVLLAEFPLPSRKSRYPRLARLYQSGQRLGALDPSSLEHWQSVHEGRLVLARLPKERYSRFEVVEQPLAGEDDEGRPYEWSRYFPTIAPSKIERYRYQHPLSEEFCRIYGEPIERIREVARLFKRTMAFYYENVGTKHENPYATPRTTFDLERLLAVGPTIVFDPQGELALRWQARSLLGSLAMMAVLDLMTKGQRLVACTRCGTLFMGRHSATAYCSKRCRKAAEMKRYRAAVRERRKRN